MSDYTIKVVKYDENGITIEDQIFIHADPETIDKISDQLKGYLEDNNIDFE